MDVVKEKSMLTAEKINELIGVKESYQASDALMRILFDKPKREKMFKEFLDIDSHLEKDYFHLYFEEEHANKRTYAQDFTPTSVSRLLADIVGIGGMTMDSPAGTGSLLIQKWDKDRNSKSALSFKPSMFFYHCEELSDRALPFLLFNIMIRGMNCTVLHGDSLSREAKQVYLIHNDKDDHMTYSSLNVMPHNELVKREFQVSQWLEDAIDHIESPPFIDPNKEKKEHSKS